MRVLDGGLNIPGTVIQVHKAHLVNFIVNQKDILWIQVRVNDVIIVQDFQQVDNLQANVNDL